MIQPRKNKVVKKVAYGAAIAGASMGLGLITSLIGQNKAKKEARVAKSLADTNNFNTAVQEQDIYAEQFNNDNLNDLPVYASGGQLNTNNTSTTGKYDTVGGDLLPISDNAEVVDGNTHEENTIDSSYGVTLSENGDPVANVEDKEVVVDNELVFSDKLKKGDKTFAEIAMGINTKIGELQAKNKGSIKPAEKFSTERTVQGLENMNKILFQEQELVKANTIGTEDETVDVVNGSVPMGRNGLDINKPNLLESPVTNTITSNVGVRDSTMATDLLPMLGDNITNLLLTSSAPAVPKPIMKRAPILDTRVNVNPQLATVNETIAANNEVIRGNTNNSSIARANMTATNLKGLEVKNNVYANKQAQERQLKNQQVVATTNVANENADLTMDYQDDVRDSRLQKNSAYSQNIKNLTEDITAIRQNDLQKDADDNLLMLGLLDDPTGEKGRTFGRLGRNLSNKSRTQYLKELERMKKFNDNKKK